MRFLSQLLNFTCAAAVGISFAVSAYSATADIGASITILKAVPECEQYNEVFDGYPDCYAAIERGCAYYEMSQHREMGDPAPWYVWLLDNGVIPREC